MLERAEAQERRRQHQQGFGKPIISGKIADQQLVAIGNTVYFGKYRTFEDFLLRDIKNVLGLKWGSAEQQKPLEARHPILQWADALGRAMENGQDEPGGIRSMPMTGAAAAYIGLAYNLFLLRHDAELRARLIERLKNVKDFYGAYYETFAAAVCIRAGFELSIEDEEDGLTTHGEFIAKHKVSGCSYHVECKTRAPNKTHSDVGNQLKRALEKQTTLERIVLIDLNLADDPSVGTEEWARRVSHHIRSREGKLTIKGQPAPVAYVVVTNYPYHHHLDGTGTNRAAVGDGFKIPDFGCGAQFASLIDAFKSLQKHSDVVGLIQAFRDYQIPSTFDGEIPEFAFGEAERRWIVGETYDLSAHEPGAVGVLTTAFASPDGKEAHLAFHLRDGRNLITRVELSEAETAAYLRHPDTFFGTYIKPGRQCKTPLHWFEFFYKNFKSAPRETMLEWFKNASDFEDLSKLPTDELLLVYCDRHVGAVLARGGKRTKPDKAA